MRVNLFFGGETLEGCYKYGYLFLKNLKLMEIYGQIVWRDVNYVLQSVFSSDISAEKTIFMILHDILDKEVLSHLKKDKT